MALHLLILFPFPSLVTWTISGKDCQVVCNLKPCSRGLSAGSANQIAGCDLLTTILPVTRNAGDYFINSLLSKDFYPCCPYQDSFIYFNCNIKINKSLFVFQFEVEVTVHH